VADGNVGKLKMKLRRSTIASRRGTAVERRDDDYSVAQQQVQRMLSAAMAMFRNP
jgi:hypothetical protein